MLSHRSVQNLAALVLTLGSFVGCRDKPDADGKTGSTTSASLTAPAVSAAAPKAGGGAFASITGTCKKKDSCKELYSPLSPMEEDMCKGLEGDGVLRKGADPCPKEKLLGSCKVEAPDANHVLYYYKTGPTDDASGAKSVCESVMSGKWDEPAGAQAAPAKGADASCDAVVAKLMSLQKSPAGNAEKKLFGKMCAGMDSARKQCILSSTSMADVQSKCGGGKAF